MGRVLQKSVTTPDGLGDKSYSYTYTLTGNLLSSSGDSVNTTVYQYNLANKLKSLTNSNNNVTLSNYTYDYYLDGNQSRKNESKTNKLIEYLYDGLGRLESEIEKESGNVASTIAYTYDDYNNRATMTQDGVETSYKYDANSRLKTETVVSGEITEITSYGYDDNGNQIMKSTGTIKPQEEGATENIEITVLGVNGDGTASCNEYDGFNQLVKVISGEIAATYEYNGDGLRSSKIVNGMNITHVWDGTQIALELDGQGGCYKQVSERYKPDFRRGWSWRRKLLPVQWTW